MSFDIDETFLKLIDNHVKRLKIKAQLEGIDDDVEINEDIVLEKIIENYFLINKKMDENVEDEGIPNIFDFEESEVKELFNIELLEKEKNKMMKDELYTSNGNTIESYIKNSKLFLEFIEEDILESLRNYFSRNELAILHKIVHREKREVISEVFESFTSEFKLSFNMFYVINTADRNTWGLMNSEKTDIQLLTKIAIKIYQLKEHEVFILIHFLITEPYESMEENKNVMSKLSGNKINLEWFLKK